MNFKELIKIPVPPAPQTDIPAEVIVFVPSTYYQEGGYNKTVKNYIYLAEIVDKMLIVTVYQGGNFSWRTFVTDTDYCTQKAGNPKKSTASVEKITEYGQSYIPFDGAGETIKRYVDTFYRYDILPPSNLWHHLEQGMDTVNALQTRIRKKKTAERHRKIREATEECMLEIRPPVKAFTEWLKHQSRSIKIIYHTGDDYGVCTHCLKKVERGKAKWKHRQHITCPHCRKKAELICSGRFRDGRIEVHTELFWYVQKTSEGCCTRGFRVNYDLCKNTVYGKENSVPITHDWNKSMDCYEICRVFLDRNGNVDKSFIWDNFMQTGENYWCRNGDVFFNAWFYTGNLRQALSNYPQLKYIPWDKVTQIVEQGYIFDIIKTLIRRPWIEYLIKVGMKSLAHDYLYNRYDTIKASEFVNGKTDTNAKPQSLAHILGLNRRQLREIIPYDPDIRELNLYKLLLRNRAGLEEWKPLRDYSNCYKEISLALEYQPVSRYLKYIAEQAELYQQQDYGDIMTVIIDYDDYLREAKDAEYNMEDTATINPKNLITAHSDSQIDSDLVYYRQTYEKYADELAAAAENIAKVKGITYEDKQYRIAPIMSWEELFNESKCLRHCVASYAKKYADGNCIIFGVRNISAPDIPMYTLELSGNFKYVQQCRGFKNKSAPENVMEVVKKWQKNLVAKNIKKAG